LEPATTKQDHDLRLLYLPRKSRPFPTPVTWTSRQLFEKEKSDLLKFRSDKISRVEQGSRRTIDQNCRQKLGSLMTMMRRNLKDVEEQVRQSPKGKLDGRSKNISVALGRDPESLD